MIVVRGKSGRGTPIGYIILSKDDSDNLAKALKALKVHMASKGVAAEPM